MKHLYQAAKDLWTGDKSFTFLLIVLVIYMFGLIPFFTDNLFSKICFLIFYYILLSSSIPFLRGKTQKLITRVLVVLPFLFLVFEIFFVSLWSQALIDFCIIGYCSMLGYILLIRTFAKGRIDNRRIQGSIIVYLLLGLVFCLLYHSISLLSRDDAFKGLTGTNRKEFLYFSLTTLTTAGYGDIVPLSPVARSFANMEALLGQLYPAVLIARLVSMQFSYDAQNTKS